MDCQSRILQLLKVHVYSLFNKLYYFVTIEIGLKFWKVGSRKIYAVHKEEIITHDNSSDDINPPKKRKSQEIIQEIKSLRQEISSLKSSHVIIPPSSSLYGHMYESFLCQICRVSPAHPPVIFTNCCKMIIGCKTCVDEWYKNGMNLARNCPLCRAEMGATEVVEIKGLDDFLKAIKPILNSDPEAGSSSSQ